VRVHTGAVHLLVPAKTNDARIGRLVARILRKTFKHTGRQASNRNFCHLTWMSLRKNSAGTNAGSDVPT
ncbi:MAG: hypothetical protein KDA91_23400, partial [Planctomycetaceae bacterium]|nr:hypothetical protein [Planctomycetaceae bacterium]